MKSTIPHPAIIAVALTASASGSRVALTLSSEASEAPGIHRHFESYARNSSLLREDKKRQLRSRTVEEHRTLEWTQPSLTCSPENCPTSSHLCLANPNHPQRTTDDTCSPCQNGQSYWPCDVAGLCYCWDTSNGDKKIPPAPSTKSIEEGGGLENNSKGNYVWQISHIDPCDILTEEVFKTLAPQAVAPYTYAGFCEAVTHYNADHPSEGVFNMGTETNQRMELAAFLGNALHESDEFKAGREYLMCADQIIQGGETYCKPCDVSAFDWDTMKCSASLASEGRAFNSYCQSNLLPPDACQCDDVYEEENPSLAGYVKADRVYFGRGSIQLSWNYNYIRASVALTGAPETFCQRPDLVATKEDYAWGAGIFYWMENIKNDKSCHQSVLLNSEFGETLDNINGGLECPADDSGWHGEAVKLRLNRYCRASTALGLDRLLALDGCMDMDKKMEQCLEDGICEDCKTFVGKVGLLEDVSNESEGNDANKLEANSTIMEPEVAIDVQQETPNQQNKPNGNSLPQPPVHTGKPAHTTTSEPSHSPTKLYIPKGPCSGDPCFIPPEITNDPNNTLQFCRNSDGICGAGPTYCNAASTWTTFCHDCDIDSLYGCPTYGCSDCLGESQICVGNLNGFNPISDDDCAPCAKGQSYWPCDIQSAEGCWCYDKNLPRVEPAAPSGLELDNRSGRPSSISIGHGVCGLMIDESLFNALAPHAVAPFTYQGFCESIDHYNAHHAEKVFRMGSYQDRLSELAAFLGIASHETNNFVASREYLACGDNLEVDGVLYCKPCSASDYNYDTHKCSVSMLAGDQSYMDFCQPYTTPPDGCSCEYVKQVEATGILEGHMRANDIFFGRGSIQLSHNFNYIRASATMTGSEDTFCTQPEMLASIETYGWGVGLYLWMDRMNKEGMTCHVSVLKNGDFGGALSIINGGSECPVKEDDEFYSEAIKNRLDHYCNVAQVLGVPNLLGLSGCEGLEEVFATCMSDGSCPRCKYWDPSNVHTVSPTLSRTSDPETSDLLGSPSTQNRPHQQHFGGNSNFEESEHETTSSTTQATTARPPRTPHPTTRPTRGPTRNPKTISPTEASTSNLLKSPSKSPTAIDIPSLTEVAEKVPDEASANKFAFFGLTSYDSSDGEPPIQTQADSFALISHAKEISPGASSSDRTQSPTPSPTTASLLPITTTSPSATSETSSTETSSPVVAETSSVVVDAFSPGVDSHEIITGAHSKENNLGALSMDHTKSPTPSPVAATLSPVTEMPSPAPAETPSSFAETFSPVVDSSEMTNWALTRLDDESNHQVTEPPTDAPINYDINVQDIVFRPPSNSKDAYVLNAGISVSKQEALPTVETLLTSSPSFGMNNMGTVVETNNSEDASTGFISGRVWLVTKDGNRLGLRGILIDLFRCNSTEWIAGTRTASAGDYIFEELSDGNYYIVVTAGNSYSFTDHSNDIHVGSDGKGECIELSPSEKSHTVNAGLVNSAISLPQSAVAVSGSNLHSNISAVESAEEFTDNCRGQPCSEGDGTWCRSKYSFCGKGDEYCNEFSQWKPDCGTGTPTEKPSFPPSTSQPTFVFDLQLQCSGEPCIEGDGTWCRSEIGFCGGGSLYCNGYSQWIPQCVTLIPTKFPSQDNTKSETNLTIPGSHEPSAVPSQGPPKDSLGFSSFALPTLVEISPKQAHNINATGHERTSYKSDMVTEGAEDDNRDNSGTNSMNLQKSSTIDTSWNDQYWYLATSTTSMGFQSVVCCKILSLTLFFASMSNV